jgi:hypothetical protein
MNGIILSLLIVLAFFISCDALDNGSLAGSGIAGRDAWVYLASRCNDFFQAMSSARTLRIHRTNADIVVMVFGELGDMSVVRAGFGSLIDELSIRVLVTSAPVSPDTVTNSSTRFWIEKRQKWW